MKKKVQKCDFVFTLALIFFVCGCGLETTYNIASPRTYESPPTYDTIDPSRRIFTFVTNESSAASVAVQVLGTAVYYRIYTDSAALLNANSAVDSINTSTTSTSVAALQAITSRGYRELGAAGGTTSPLITVAGTNQIVEIRLSNYQETTSPEWAAHIIVNSNTETARIPRRNGDMTSFDFGRTEGNDDTEVNRIPGSGDNDFTSGSFSESGVYYVDMYAVNVGYDETFTQQYSRLLHLGAVRIDSNTRDN